MSGGSSRRFGNKKCRGVMMMMVVVMLSRQRIQSVHDHGGRPIWDDRRCPFYCWSTCSAFTHYTESLVSARRGVDLTTRHQEHTWGMSQEDISTFTVVTGLRIQLFGTREFPPALHSDCRIQKQVFSEDARHAPVSCVTVTRKLVAKGEQLHFYEWSICSIFGSRNQGSRPMRVESRSLPSMGSPLLPGT